MKGRGFRGEERERVKGREERENLKFCLLVLGLKPDDIIFEVFRNMRSHFYVK